MGLRAEWVGGVGSWGAEGVGRGGGGEAANNLIRPKTWLTATGK